MVQRAKNRLRHVRRGVLLAVVAAIVMTLGLVALADHPGSSGFNIDGNVPDGTAFLFADEFGNVKELGPLNQNTTKLGVIHTDPLPTLGTSNPNGQVDLRNVWFDSNTAAGTDWLYFAWERDSNKGSGVIAIEFQQDAAPSACDYAGASQDDLIAGCNPWANRDAGDFLLLWDQVGNDIVISIRTFDGTVFGPPVELNEHQFDATLSADNFKGEAVVDLGFLFPPEPTECLSIANVIPGTITGNSDTADYKDTVLADITDAITITNCGSLKLLKVDSDGDPLAGAEFTLYESDGDEVFDDDVVVDTCTTGADGICEIKDILFGEYWIDETVVPANHQKAPGLPQKVTIIGTTQVDLGTFVNNRLFGSILVEKVLDGTTTRIGGAGFSLDGDGDPETTDDQTTIPAVSGQTGLFCIDELVYGSYNVIETTVPSGYEAVGGVQTFVVNSMSDCDTRSSTPDLTFENTKLTSLVTTANQEVVVGQKIADTATLSGGSNPTGTISFKLYDNNTCTGDPIFETSVDVDQGNGDYTVEHTPSAPGTYYWLASYSGDASNKGSSHDCAVDGEVDTVIKASPSITTSANEVVTVGQDISDSATLSGGVNPTGTITFALYDNNSCSGTAIFTQDVNVDSGNGSYGPVSYTTTAPGMYYWVATYNGDANNNTATHNCGITGEVDTVIKAGPSITTSANESVTVGQDISDSATLSGGVNPTGTITFALYDNNSCSGTAIFTQDVTVDSGNGPYGPVSYTTDTVGTFYWKATYNGDANNNTATHACGATGEVDTVNPASPALSTTPNLLPNDSATLSGGFGTLSGSLLFELHLGGTCDGTALYSESVSVDGAGTYQTSNTTVFITADGLYSWKVTYSSGDNNNNGALSACDAEQYLIDITPLDGGPS